MGISAQLVADYNSFDTVGGHDFLVNRCALLWLSIAVSRIPAVCLKTELDDRIPFIPGWIWLYSFLYYLMIGITVVSIQDLGEGVHIIFGGLILLVTGCAMFYFFPNLRSPCIP